MTFEVDTEMRLALGRVRPNMTDAKGLASRVSIESEIQAVVSAHWDDILMDAKAEGREP